MSKKYYCYNCGKSLSKFKVKKYYDPYMLSRGVKDLKYIFCKKCGNKVKRILTIPEIMKWMDGIDDY